MFETETYINHLYRRRTIRARIHNKLFSQLTSQYTHDQLKSSNSYYYILQIRGANCNSNILITQGISELTPPIRRWIYLGTVFAPTAIPLLSYGLIVGGAFIIIFVFVTAYKHFVFATDPTVELLELGKRQLRRGSSLLITGQHRIIAHRDSYHLLRPSKPPSVHRNHSAQAINTTTSSDSNEDEWIWTRKT